jgi:hypothetical protein
VLLSAFTAIIHGAILLTPANAVFTSYHLHYIGGGDTVEEVYTVP